MKPQPLFLCPTTKKRQYDDEAQAQSAIDKWIGAGRPARCYQCPHCDLWHLTSTTAGVEFEAMDWTVAMVLDHTNYSPKSSTRSTIYGAMADVDPGGEMVYGFKSVDDRRGLIIATRPGKGAVIPTLSILDFIKYEVAADHLPGWMCRAEFPFNPPRNLMTHTGFIPNTSTRR